eukprot:TRINITY_DN344_c1_g1_i2.p1 TRINITY_DN344_c1_g1~~TRINITY_DN344_c1_g1_i2.p1  ORF type:complete len:372 (-),score=78.47 TRINITY_DN344_c1_g1_i2:227-1342(-)
MAMELILGGGLQLDSVQSFAALVQDPALSWAAWQHPSKVWALLQGVDVAAAKHLVELVGEETAHGLLVCLLEEVDEHRFVDFVAPLVNNTKLHGSMACIVSKTDHAVITEIVRLARTDKMELLLAARPHALAAVAGAVDVNRIGTLLAVMQMQDEIIKKTVLPLLDFLEHPEALASLVNNADPHVLLWVLRGVDVDHLAGLLTLLDPSDLQDGGSIVAVLKACTAEPELLQDKILPLLQHSDPARLVPLLRGVPTERLLEMLRRVEVDSLLRLLEHTKTDVVLRVCNGPLDSMLVQVAASLGSAMKNPVAASMVRKTTNILSAGIMVAQKATEHFETRLQAQKPLLTQCTDVLDAGTQHEASEHVAFTVSL